MIFKILSICTVATLTALLLWFVQFKFEQKRNAIRYKDGRIVPGPPPSFPFGNVKQIRECGSLSRAVGVWRKQYGDEFQFWFGSRSFLYLHDLDALKDASSTNSPFLSRFQSWAHREAWKNRGIVMCNESSHHKIHRAAALTRLMKTSYLRRIADITCERMDKQLEILSSQSEGKPLEVQAETILQNVTFDIIGQAAFSMDLQSVEGGSKYEESYSIPFRKGLQGITTFGRMPIALKYILYPKWKAVQAARKKVDTFHRMILQERWREKQQGIVREDFMDYLVTEKDPRTNANFTEQEILSDIADLLGAGHETTSNTLCFALYFLSWNLEAQQTLQEECDRFPSELSYEDAARLTYTQGVIKETLRLQPTVEGLGRQTETKQTYRNFVMPEKSSFFFSMLQFGHDPKYFPDPEKFDPTRWTKNSSDDSAPNEAWFPFGMGARVCVGNRMAMMEGKILLCKLMQKFSVRRLSDAPLTIENAITSRPKGGLRLQFVPRS